MTWSCARPVLTNMASKAEIFDFFSFQGGLITETRFFELKVASFETSLLLSHGDTLP